MSASSPQDKTNQLQTAGPVTSTGMAANADYLTRPPLFVPDSKGRIFKSEITLTAGPDKTEKLNFWWHPDDDRAPNFPHNHPWDFAATVFDGWYVEHRYWIDGDGKLHTEQFVYRQGEQNIIHREKFHIVVAVRPGTRTKMVCGPASEGNTWGYLDLNTLQYLTTTQMKEHAEYGPGQVEFMQNLTSINPQFGADQDPPAQPDDELIDRLAETLRQRAEQIQP